MADKTRINGGPAFPQPAFIDPETGQTVQQPVEGLSIQTYAAIHLCVPMSEHPIINEMINKARLDRFAAQAPSEEIESIMPPKWQDFDKAADFLGMPRGYYQVVEHWPLVIAKARQILADAMINVLEAANE